MPKMLTGERLLEAVRENRIILGGDESCAEGVKYDFRLSEHILKAKFGRPVKASELSSSDKRDLVIEPGEVIFALTQERLSLPTDVVVQLSHKRKLSHKGIITLGGTYIDPGYVGRILIGLYNISSTPFPIRPGKKVISGTVLELEKGEKGTFPEPSPPMDEFPDELVDVMHKYDPIAFKSVEERLKHLQAEVETLRSEISSHENWYNQFKGLLESHNEQIGELTRDLRQETEARMTGQDKLTQTLSWLKGAAWAGIGILGIALALLIAWLAGWLPGPNG